MLVSLASRVADGREKMRHQSEDAG